MDEPWWPLEWSEGVANVRTAFPRDHPHTKGIWQDTRERYCYCFVDMRDGTLHESNDLMELRCALLELAYPGVTDDPEA